MKWPMDICVMKNFFELIFFFIGFWKRYMYFQNVKYKKCVFFKLKFSFLKNYLFIFFSKKYRSMILFFTIVSWTIIVMLSENKFTMVKVICTFSDSLQ